MTISGRVSRSAPSLSPLCRSRRKRCSACTLPAVSARPRYASHAACTAATLASASLMAHTTDDRRGSASAVGACARASAAVTGARSACPAPKVSTMRECARRCYATRAPRSSPRARPGPDPGPASAPARAARTAERLRTPAVRTAGSVRSWTAHLDAASSPHVPSLPARGPSILCGGCGAPLQSTNRHALGYVQGPGFFPLPRPPGLIKDPALAAILDSRPGTRLSTPRLC